MLHHLLETTENVILLRPVSRAQSFLTLGHVIQLAIALSSSFQSTIIAARRRYGMNACMTKNVEFFLSHKENFRVAVNV
jgi:hypothetical protein